MATTGGYGPPRAGGAPDQSRFLYLDLHAGGRVGLLKELKELGVEVIEGEAEEIGDTEAVTLQADDEREN